MMEEEESIEIDEVETSRIFGPNLSMSLNQMRKESTLKLYK